MNAIVTLKTFSNTENTILTDSFQDMISILHADISNARSHWDELLRALAVDSNAFVLILVQCGQAEFTMDYKTHTIAPGKLTFIMPNHDFQFTDMSDDFNARLLILDPAFQNEVGFENKGFYNYLTMKRNPVIRVEPEDEANLANALTVLQEKIRNRSHLYHKELVYNATTGLILEVQNVLMRRNDTMIHPVLTRKEEVVDRFLKLLAKHGKQQHTLAYYADQLFITAQYLSAILKEQTGKSGSKWINEALIMEAKKLLKSPYSSIQDVAYTLNFSDQSTFGKFFKKSIGMSPLVYKRIS
ncbi:AraC family transcriptional regulator [Parabacteroides sp. PF5-6]|uniref:helix-turn-helix domain-containing protein n=1 Tax=Parabacteroides sp. PF5-6 TaxID=1742403 RepID=UPI002407646B|nr:AraC family transcriptional regulator [Parabacteroides sp. PF5-6]MDF9829132.1 AraC family transcriptional activator of pobA [Parabacteroides sp. PF5-6]